MAKGDSLKKYKMEQKAQTHKRIKEVIEELKQTGAGKITVSKIATLAGITRASIYANYQDLLEDLEVNSKKQPSSHSSKEQNETIEKLKAENKVLRTGNKQLMDQIIALKAMLKKQEL
jgi:cell division protein FtsB